MAARAGVIRFLKWAAIVLAVLVLLAILVWAAARLTGTTASQRAALETMQLPPEPSGRNGFAALWVLPYDVPTEMEQAILAEDARLQAERPDWTGAPDSAMPVESYKSVAAERYADLRIEEGALPKYCGLREPECLERVAANVPGFTELLERDALLVGRVERLADFDYFSSPLKPAIDSQVPALQLVGRTLSRNALAFVNGDVDQALQGTCRDVSTARKLIRNPDSLVASMVGAGMLHGSAYQFADMLSQLPLEHPVPPLCTNAFAPPSPGEFEVCDAMRQEYRLTAQGLMGVIPTGALEATPLDRLTGRLLYDEAKTKALHAEGMALWCSAEAAGQVALDLPATVDLERFQRPLWSLSCLDNAIGCILGRIAAPAYHDYQRRLQDAAARLHLVGILLELRESPPAPEQLGERITTLGEAERPGSPRTYQLASDGGAIAMSVFERARNEPWRVPLPLSLRATAPPAPAPAPAQAAGQ